MKQVTLDIQGMHCASCVARVERSLRAVPGVRSAGVSLALGQGMVEAEDGADEGAMTAAVAQEGYEASLANGHAHGHGPEHGGGHAHGQDREGEARAWKMRAILGMALAAPLAALGMFWMSATSAAIQGVLAVVILGTSGRPLFRGGVRALLRGRADMDSLVALGAGAAMGVSVWQMMRGSHMVYFDSAGVIVALVALGKWLEARARGEASRAITALMDIAPARATVERGGKWVEVAAEEVGVGDVLLVRPGERIAADGAVASASGAAVDESMMTGESAPVNKEPGDRATGGTVLLSGSLTIRAERVGSETALAQVARLVGEAQGRKARVERLADAVASVFVPVVIVVAIGTLAGWALLAGDDGWTRGVMAAVSVLVVACPCALGLAVPAAVMVGTGMGARRGILIKDPAVLEKAGRLDAIVLDKTGTLTEGRPSVRQVATFERGIDEKELLRLAGAVESRSEHPIARAIVRKAIEAGVPERLLRCELFRSVAGGGVRGEVDGVEVLIGPASMAADAEKHAATVDALERDGATVVAVMEASLRDEMHGGTPTAGWQGGTTRGLIALEDKARPGAAEAVRSLKSLGLRVVMMSGDSEAAARGAAARLGIDEVHSRVMPDQKVSRVREMQARGLRVAMAGDGINDGPALAAADVGIAMGSGTDVAKEAGAIVLVGSDVRLVAQAVRLSRAMMRRVRAGLAWAFAYNIVLIPVAAAGWLHPMLAAGAMSLSSVSVVFNALWLRRVNLS